MNLSEIVLWSLIANCLYTKRYTISLKEMQLKNTAPFIVTEVAPSEVLVAT